MVMVSRPECRVGQRAMYSDGVANEAAVQLRGPKCRQKIRMSYSDIVHRKEDRKEVGITHVH